MTKSKEGGEGIPLVFNRISACQADKQWTTGSECDDEDDDSCHRIPIKHVACDDCWML